ncbi:MAG: hypothetical protein MUF72_08930 [Elainella sp. Prado103]|nr:hypothetical protein [Elainella sp. Prado103]
MRQKLPDPAVQTGGLNTALRHALTLNADFYEDSNHLPHHRRIALTIVFLASISHALGGIIILLVGRVTLPLLLLGTTISALSIIAGYYLWTFTIWQIGRQIHRQWDTRRPPTYTELLTPIGLAYAPQVFNFLTLIPLLGRAIELGLAAWSLLAVIVAVRQGLDIKTGQAMLISLLFWLPLQIAIGVIQSLQPALMQSGGSTP